MKHLEPLPASKTQNNAQQKGAGKRVGIWSLFIVAAVILATGFFLTTFFNQPSGDDLSDARKTQLVEEFAKIGALQLQTVPSGEIQSAIDSMGLDKAQKKTLQQDVTKPADQNTSPQQRDGVQLVYLELWDFATQDGDSVLISSGGYQATLPLFKAPMKIAIPVLDGQTIQVAGVQDGGGGITLGIKNGQGQAALPVLAPGQSLQLPVAF